MSSYPARLNNKSFQFNEYLQVDKRENLEAGYPMHWHEFYEIDIVLGGECEFTINGVKYNLQKGQISFLSPIDFHSLSIINNSENFVHYNIMFYGEFISDTVTMLLNHAKLPLVAEPNSDAFKQIVEYCETLIKNENRCSHLTKYYLKNILECLVIDILNCTPIKNGVVSENIIYVRKALKYIQDNFTVSLTPKDVAAHCGFSQSHMTKIFKEFTGMTFHDYILQLRCRYARNLICSTDIKLLDICFESGFNSFSQFSRNFRYLYGISPGAYRKKFEHEFI